ncbi:unnamed protein product, partial [Allacma fusca]
MWCEFFSREVRRSKIVWCPSIPRDMETSDSDSQNSVFCEPLGKRDCQIMKQITVTALCTTG